MNNEKGFMHIGLAVVLGAIFLLLFSWGRRGYGYMGYRGYNHGPSWWYWGGSKYHYGRSVRDGSIRGRSHRGGGFRGGK
jgi:hypothetical protein